jgi:dCMP deaminase
MRCALAMSELSHAQRRKVGAILVSPQGGIIAEGFNGTPSGFDNNCESNLITKPEVLHAESNAITKVAKSTNSSAGATL